MLSQFTFQIPTKIIFGQPAVEALIRELTALDATRILLVSDPGLADLGVVDRFSTALIQDSFGLDTFTEVSSNPTTIEVATGLEQARGQHSQAIIALGGGSAIDVAKAIAMLLANGGSYADYQWGEKPITERSWPMLAVPTTAGTGSEVSRVAVIVDPDNPFKKGVLSPLMFPHVAVIDPQLTRSLPARLTAATGIDAFSHALEAYLGQGANPFTTQLALAALDTAWTALPQATTQGENLKARQLMMLAALWGGLAMDHAGLGLIHALSGPLTSHLHLHHGLANAIILPYAVRFNLPAISVEKRHALNRIAGLDPQVDGLKLINKLFAYIRALDLPTNLQALQIPLDNIGWESIAAETVRMGLIKNNPRPVSVADCRRLLDEMRSGNLLEDDD